MIITAISFSVSHPFRKPMYQNYFFMFFILSNTFFAFYFIVLNEVQWVQDTFYVSYHYFICNYVCVCVDDDNPRQFQVLDAAHRVWQ